MNNYAMRALRALTAAAGLIVLSTGVHAKTTWTFSYENNCTAGCDDNYANGADWSRTYTGFDSGSPAGAVTVYGIYNTGQTSTSNPNPASGAGSGEGQLWRGPIDAWNGLGVHTYNEGWSSPQHSTDSQGSIESILFDFGAEIALSEVSLGWKSNDADISVLAYVPHAGNPTTPSIAAAVTGTVDYTNLNATYAGLLSSGWDVIGHYGDLAVGQSGKRAINASAVSSRYWLISAATSALGWTGDKSTDYFKVYTVSGDKPPNGGCNGDCGSVPVPGTLMLFGIVGFGVAGRRYLTPRA